MLDSGKFCQASDIKKNDPDDPYRDGTARDDTITWYVPLRSYERHQGDDTSRAQMLMNIIANIGWIRRRETIRITCRPFWISLQAPCITIWRA